ncbi:MAG TPA: thermonuclease family protein [Acidimicrobiales bacterium]
MLLAVLAVLAAAACLAVGRAASELGSGSGSPGAPGQATVVRVVDGDTLVVELAGREVPVRLIGIDTPETVAPGRPVECYGAEASDHLRALAPAGTAVRLERDVEARDMYDRLLAYVYRSGDGLLLNRAQVDGGFAEADDHPPNTALRSELHAAEAAARAAGAGLWSACGSADVAVGPPPARDTSG